MSWLQLNVNVTGDQVAQVVDAFEQLGSQATTQQNAGEDAYFDLAHPAEPKWDVQTVTGLFEDDNNAKQLIIELMNLASFIKDVEITQLADQDWETVWLDQYKPIMITNKLWVYPSWIEPESESKTIIKIDPGMAFGTGTHETTRLCMKVLSTQEIVDKTVLDYGCGSGILAITAIKLAAKSAVGVDIDPKAEIVSQQNARINGVDDRFAIQSAQDVEGEKFNIIIANILAFALVALAPKLIKNAHKNSILILSGILAEQAQGVIYAYRDYFNFEQFQDNDWVVLRGQYLD